MVIGRQSSSRWHSTGGNSVTGRRGRGTAGVSVEELLNLSPGQNLFPGRKMGGGIYGSDLFSKRKAFQNSELLLNVVNERLIFIGAF